MPESSVDAPPPVPPWKRSVQLQPKPMGSEYGYVRSGKAVPCSREELEALCRDPRSPVFFVWSPESPYVESIYNVRDLFEAARERTRAGLVGRLKNTAALTALFGFFWYQQGFATHSFLFLLMVVMGVLPALQFVWQLWELRRLTPAKMSTWMDSIDYELWIGTQPARVTIGLIVMLAVVFVCQLLAVKSDWAGQLQQVHWRSIALAGMDKEAVRNGEYWRLLTGTLLHGGPIHILFNGAALRWLGRPIEILAGWKVMVLTFAASMLGGALLSLLLLPTGTSVGSSGGVLGLLGFLIVFGLRYRGIMPDEFTKNMVANVVLIACLGIAAWQMIDNAGHLGGLVSGIVVGLLAVPRTNRTLPLKVPRALEVAGWIAVAYVAVSFAFVMIKLLPAVRF